jgi:hypothetical protein
MSTKKQSEVAEIKEEPKELAQVVESPLDSMFEEDAGSGLEGIGANDQSIPYFSILQKGSPQVNAKNAKYIKGAMPGMIFNTVSSEIYLGEPDGEEEYGLPWIPCGYQKRAVRWRPRDSGGGLVCQYDETDPILKTFKVNEKGQLYDEATKDIIVDTAYHVGIHINRDGMPEFGVVSMASTQLKTSRNWNTLMKKVMKKNPKTGKIFNPPSYSHIYRLSTAYQTKDNYDWYGWKVISETEIQDVNMYRVAREFAIAFEKGEVRISAPPKDFDAVDYTEGSAVRETPGGDIPF